MPIVVTCCQCGNGPTLSDISSVCVSCGHSFCYYCSQQEISASDEYGGGGVIEKAVGKDLAAYGHSDTDSALNDNDEKTEPIMMGLFYTQ